MQNASILSKAIGMRQRVARFEIRSCLLGASRGGLSLEVCPHCSLGATPVEILQADADSNPSEWFSRWQMRTYSWPKCTSWKKSHRAIHPPLFFCRSFRNLNLNMRVEMCSWYLIFKHTKRVCQFETSRFLTPFHWQFQVKKAKGRKCSWWLYVSKSPKTNRFWVVEPTPKLNCLRRSKSRIIIPKDVSVGLKWHI